MQDTAEDTVQQLHRIIDELSPEAVQAMRAVAELLRPREIYYDEEELSEEGKRILAEGRISLANEPLTDHEDFRRELGL